ncbi:hypothetical protein [Salisediminibacterium selenitireducens]|uniref:DUF5673 domain-containing protein n=1 Tax=Bacillus selenitireducens (strain ATCC 700615 / DSM 15326 / MLS10) TaxID=439292 RepID=D6XT71_BACIE|nr:hypothetical protein [Salisediminibacterium selenitireducens]ADH99007.1 hypothetical protein Bsel_1495 [[Bacillus] selenitireducens MLS10]
MEWLFLFTAGVVSAVAVYHLFTHKHRENSGDQSFFSLTDPRKLTVASKTYKASVYAGYAALPIGLVLVLETFNNFVMAFLLFLIQLFIGSFILVTLDRVFEIYGGAIVFAGFHAKWSRVKEFRWGKKTTGRRQLIMETTKGQRIKTKIAPEDQERVEEVLSDFAYFEKDQS